MHKLFGVCKGAAALRLPRAAPDVFAERAVGNASPSLTLDPRPMNDMRGMPTSTADSASGMFGMVNGLSPEMQNDRASVRGVDAATLHALLPHHRMLDEHG